MVTVLTYYWPGKRYEPRHVQILAASVAKWMPEPYQFLCVTDREVPGVQTVPTPAREYAGRCYRRLWLFSEAAQALGPAILHLDLDMVVCGDLTPFVTGRSDFAIYRAGSVAARGYSLNPSLFYLKTGSQTDIWKTYTHRPVQVAAAANADGFWGSDQAVISYLRRDAPVDTFGDADGLVSFRRIRSEHLTELPPGTRVVSFHGKRSPFEREIQLAHPWIRKAWAA